MSLILSDILGGPEQIDKPFESMLNKICQRMVAIENDHIDPEDAKMSIIFEYHGSIWKPDFVGIRVGRITKDKKRLRVSVAFPPDKLGPDCFVEVYSALLKEAIIQGKKSFDKKGIPFSLEKHLALVEIITKDVNDV